MEIFRYNTISSQNACRLREAKPLQTLELGVSANDREHAKDCVVTQVFCREYIRILMYDYLMEFSVR